MEYLNYVKAITEKKSFFLLLYQVKPNVRAYHIGCISLKETHVMD